MENLTFDKKPFIRSVSIFTILITAWTILVVRYNHFTENDKGFLTGLGFLIIFSVSLYLGQKDKSVEKFFYLLITILLLYSFSSFILSLFILRFTNSYLLYIMINAILVSTVMTVVLDKLYKIKLRKQTVVLTTICILLSYLLYELFKKGIYNSFNIEPNTSIFIFFETLAIIPLLLGLNSNQAFIYKRR